MVAPGDVLDGKYRIERVIGAGGMGVVVEAWHLAFEERVALKFLGRTKDREALARFEREARTAFKIKSEHAAKVIDIGKLSTGSPYLVMEFLEGRELAEVVQEKGPLPVREAVSYVLQSCDALAEAHSHGIVHRDIKPENLFVTPRPNGLDRIKVLDFGISKVLPHNADGASELKLTATGSIIGSPYYMAPEQWLASRTVGPAADQWSLGAILYELLTGTPPFIGRNVAQLCGSVLNDQPRPMAQGRPGLSALPPGLEGVVLRCLEKMPEDRYPTLAHLALALVDYAPQRARQIVGNIVGVLQNANLAEASLQPPTTSPPPASNDEDLVSEAAEHAEPYESDQAVQADALRNASADADRPVNTLEAKATAVVQYGEPPQAKTKRLNIAQTAEPIATRPNWQLSLAGKTQQRTILRPVSIVVGSAVVLVVGWFGLKGVNDKTPVNSGNTVGHTAKTSSPIQSTNTTVRSALTDQEEKQPNPEATTSATAEPTSKSVQKPLGTGTRSTVTRPTVLAGPPATQSVLSTANPPSPPAVSSPTKTAKSRDEILDSFDEPVE